MHLIIWNVLFSTQASQNVAPYRDLYTFAPSRFFHLILKIPYYLVMLLLKRCLCPQVHYGCTVKIKRHEFTLCTRNKTLHVDLFLKNLLLVQEDYESITESLQGSLIDLIEICRGRDPWILSSPRFRILELLVISRFSFVIKLFSVWEKLDGIRIMIFWLFANTFQKHMPTTSFVSLCGCETWRLILKDWHRSSILQRLLRKIPGPMREEVTQE